MTDKDSFKNIDYWLANIHTHTKAAGEGAGAGMGCEIGSGGVQTMIIGNKTDLHLKRTVTKSQGEALAKECGVKYIETSAKVSSVCLCVCVCVRERERGKCRRSFVYITCQ